MIPLHHIVCGGVAFWVKDVGALERGVRASDVILLDGTCPMVGYPVVCGHCGERCQGNVLALVEPTLEEVQRAALALPKRLDLDSWIRANVAVRRN